MSQNVSKVLFVNSEMLPYLPESPIAAIARQLPQSIQDIVPVIFLSHIDKHVHPIVRQQGTIRLSDGESIDIHTGLRCRSAADQCGQT